MTPDSIPIVDADPDVAVREALKNSSTMEQAELDDVQTRRGISEAQVEQSLQRVDHRERRIQSDGAGVRPGVSEPARQAVAAGRRQHADDPVGRGPADVEARERTSSARSANNKIASRRARRGRALLGAAAPAGAAQRDHLGEGRHGGREAVRGRAEPLHHRQDRNTRSVHRAGPRRTHAVLAYVQALRAYWTAYYHLRRVTLYDFANKQQMSEVRQR